MRHHIRLDLKIKVSSRWHAGSGEGNLSTDRLIRRDSGGSPFIPGSTLKGVIRQSCEKLSRTVRWPDPSDPHQLDLSLGKTFVPFEDITSPVDRLFGTRYEPGGLFFRHAHLIENSPGSTLSRTRVARYRILNTARERRLFSTEYAVSDILFTKLDGWHRDLAVFAKDYPPFAYCLLIAGILAVERIGGDKSTGSGWLEDPISIERGQYNDRELNIADVLELLEPEFYQEMRGE